MSIQLLEIPILNLDSRLNEFKTYLNKQVIPDPPDDLLIIYEKRVLHEHSFFRAEKYDSPEHQEELKQIQNANGDKNKVPRNIQNPNYDKLMKYYDQITSSHSIDEALKKINELHDFLDEFKLIKSFKFRPYFLEVNLPNGLDPRLFEQEIDFSLFLNYLLTKVRNRIAKNEFRFFLQITENKFDDESSQEALDNLRASRSSEYESLVNQILEALDKDANYKFDQQQPYTFFDYLYYSSS